jgi:hypothetical protein
MPLHPHRRSTGLFLLTLFMLALALPAAAPAQVIRRVGRRLPTGEGGVVPLPYVVADNQGNQWMTYANGMTNMQGQFPVFNQLGQLAVNDQMPSSGTNTGRVDPATHELVLENMQAGVFSLTRRLLLSPDGQYMRYIDLFTNPTTADAPLNIQLSSNVNFGIVSSASITDPSRRDVVLGWAGQVNGPGGKTAVELFAGRGAKVTPTVNWPRGSNSSQASFTLTVPAGKTIGLMHLHGTAASADAAQHWAEKLDLRKLLADLPPELRRQIVNFTSGSGLAGDLEFLRGDVLDVVELRGGDRFDGNLTASSYPLQTRFGPIDLPVDSVLAMVNVGRFHPRQLLLSRDGQIYGGQMTAAAVEMDLASGQKTQIPLEQIARLGYHRQGPADADGADSPTLSPPFALLADGERLAIDPPAAPITVETRFGALALPADAIASIVIASDDSDVHTITLTDGSRFHGLVVGPDMSLILSATPNHPAVKVPIALLQNLVLHAAPDDAVASPASSTAAPASPPPLLTLTHDDKLCGTLAGTLKLSTNFDTLTLAADQVRTLSRATGASTAGRSDSPTTSSGEVLVTGWDGATFRGQLQQDDLLCHLPAGNLDLHIPVNLLQSYANPQAQAPQLMLDRIKKIVADLNADDWKQRDAAEEQLLKLGRPVMATLRGLRDEQPPEAQQRIDSVLAKLDKSPAGDKPEPANQAPDSAND